MKAIFLYLPTPGQTPSGARSAKRLDTTQTTLHKESTKDAEKRLGRVTRRANRYKLREELRSITSRERLKACGHTVVSGGLVAVRLTDGVAGFAGLSTCGSAAVCPVCAAKISARRAEEVADVLANAHAEGYSAAMVTFTLRHRKGHSLARLLEAVTHAWSRVTSGKIWAADKKKYDIGFVRALEVTYGANGWHPHIHALIIFKGNRADSDRFTNDMWERWESAVNAKGFTAEKAVGFDVSYIDSNDSQRVAEYLAKQAAAEAVFGPLKEGKKASRTPFQIISDFVQTGDVADLAIWEEWERTVRGRKFLTYSKGIRKRFSTIKEMSDEEIAAEELGSAADNIALLPSDTWGVIRKMGAYLVLDVAEEQGKVGLVRWLEERGLAWLEPSKEKAELF